MVARIFIGFERITDVVDHRTVLHVDIRTSVSRDDTVSRHKVRGVISYHAVDNHQLGVTDCIIAVTSQGIRSVHKDCRTFRRRTVGDDAVTDLVIHHVDAVLFRYRRVTEQQTAAGSIGYT